jgi:hypothetical protein
MKQKQLELSKLKKIELIRLAVEYDNYVKDFANAHGMCQDGCYPVWLSEFYDCEFQI